MSNFNSMTSIPTVATSKTVIATPLKNAILYLTYSECGGKSGDTIDDCASVRAAIVAEYHKERRPAIPTKR